VIVFVSERGAPLSAEGFNAVRNIALAWVLTLPAAMVISGALYLVFSRLF
jgi:phosphate/sulfate permease